MTISGDKGVFRPSLSSPMESGLDEDGLHSPPLGGYTATGAPPNRLAMFGPLPAPSVIELLLPGGHDAERLHKLLENHARYTNSQRAKDILADWENYQSKFRKVMPTEFRRALNELASEQAQEQATAGE